MRVQLFSGGMDSLCLWLLTGRPQPVYVRVGAPYEAAELSVLHRLERTPGLGFQPWVVDGPPVARTPAPDGHVLHRNLVLAVVAAGMSGADEVTIGALLGEASPDKSRRFLRAASRALSVSESRRVRVVAPAARWTKTGLLARTLAREPRAAGWLALTRSCYRPAGPACHDCPACFRRDVAEFHCGLRADRPALPVGATAHAGARAAWAAGPRRWPALAVNNGTAALALAGVRIHGRDPACRT